MQYEPLTHGPLLYRLWQSNFHLHIFPFSFRSTAYKFSVFHIRNFVPPSRIIECRWWTWIKFESNTRASKNLLTHLKRINEKFQQLFPGKKRLKNEWVNWKSLQAFISGKNFLIKCLIWLSTYLKCMRLDLYCWFDSKKNSFLLWFNMKFNKVNKIFKLYIWS